LDATTMTNLDTRQVTRDSLFLLAQVRIGGQEDVTRVKVRNLSAGGMMAEAPAKVVRGSRIAVELRNIGWVEGTVAWKQGDRFGIAFVDEIDPTLVRAPAESSAKGTFEVPSYTRNSQAVPASQLPGDRLRKI
jgi:hypothetical protein